MKDTTGSSERTTMDKGVSPWGSSSRSTSAIRHPTFFLRAFTLVELLTAIGIIAVLAAAVFPAVRAINRTGGREAGVNTIAVAATTARTYATKLSRVDLKTIGNPNFTAATFSGVAMLFTPNGEIRIVENDQAAISTGSSLLEELSPSRNGFTDMQDVEYIQLPRNTGVVGITKANQSYPYLYPPPFAVRYDRGGSMIIGDTNDRKAYYDSNYDGQMRTSTGTGYDRSSPYFASATHYNPDDWDSRRPGYPTGSSTTDNPGLHTNTSKHKLPFEEVETVIGVLVFSDPDFRAAGHNFLPDTSVGQRPINSSARAWLLDTDASGNLKNSKLLLFSRLTGNIVRE